MYEVTVQIHVSPFNIILTLYMRAWGFFKLSIWKVTWWTYNMYGSTNGVWVDCDIQSHLVSKVIWWPYNHIGVCELCLCRLWYSVSKCVLTKLSHNGRAWKTGRKIASVCWVRSNGVVDGHMARINIKWSQYFGVKLSKSLWRTLNMDYIS